MDWEIAVGGDTSSFGGGGTGWREGLVQRRQRHWSRAVRRDGVSRMGGHRRFAQPGEQDRFATWCVADVDCQARIRYNRRCIQTWLIRKRLYSRAGEGGRGGDEARRQGTGSE